jgi:hypothetical protein
MTLIATASAARVNRRRGSAAYGATFWHTLYLGTTRYNMAPGTPDPSRDELSPMAFLVEQDPGVTVHAHYHQQDQFQLVVNGSATLGTHPVRTVSVHFTAAYSAYGPIVAEPAEGVWYFTLRNGFDPGARFMKDAESRALLRSIPGRKHRESVAGPLSDPSASAETLFGPDPDGAAAWRYSLRPGEGFTGPDPAAGRGQYFVVTRGTATANGQELDHLSVAFVNPGDPAFPVQAGPDGADVIVMQFPHRATH